MGAVVYLYFRVLDGVGGLEEFWVVDPLCDPQRSVWHDEHGELELGHKLTVLLVQDGVGLQHLV